MIKPDKWILELGEKGGITPFNDKNVNPASYDVTIADHWICPTRDPKEFKADQITLFPGEVIAATTTESITLPRDICADLKLKSSLGRLWLNHSMSGWINPKWSGQLTLELQNLGPYPRILKAGTRVAQLIFMQMESEPLVAYGENGTGHYQNQIGTTDSHCEDYFPKIEE